MTEKHFVTHHENISVAFNSSNDNDGMTAMGMVIQASKEQTNKEQQTTNNQKGKNLPDTIIILRYRIVGLFCEIKRTTYSANKQETIDTPKKSVPLGTETNTAPPPPFFETVSVELPNEQFAIDIDSARG